MEEIPFARPITSDPPAGPPDRWDEGGVAQYAGPPVNEFLLPTSTAGAAWVDIARLVVFLIVLELLAGAVMGIIVDGTIEPDEGAPLSSSTSEGAAEGAAATDPELARALLLPTLAFRMVASIGIVALILRHRGQSARSIGLGRGSLPLDFLIGIGATVVLYGLVALTMSLLWLVWPDLPDQMEENAQRLLEMVPNVQPRGFVVVAATVGLYEELVFRGFLMTRLRRGTGSWTVGVLISTAAFTALHAVDQTTAALVSVSILSVVFSLVTIWRRSIVPAIVAHALFDLSQFLLLYWTAGDSWT